LCYIIQHRGHGGPDTDSIGCNTFRNAAGPNGKSAEVIGPIPISILMITDGGTEFQAVDARSKAPLISSIHEKLLCKRA
jgi:hypothetical protein